MVLTSRATSDAKIGHEKRVFGCAKCNSSATVIVPDPLKSDALRWLSGELGRKD
jgi:hypothetical protein